MKRTLFFACLALCALVGLIVVGTSYATSAAQWSSVPGSFAGPRAGGATATPTLCVASYTCGVTAGATIVPGTTDTGNHTDDGTTFVSLPFPVSLYGVSYNGVNVSSNGNAQFLTTNEEFESVCLPFGEMGPTIFAYWDDLNTEGTTCTGGCGIYTSVSGSAPNRIFNIEWRTFYFSNPGNAYFEIRLYEASSNFEVILGTLNTGATATIGVQDGAGRFTQCLCNTAPTQNSRITFTATTAVCGTATPTVTPGGTTSTSTPTRTNTPVPTSTNTATNTPTRTNTAVPTNTNTHQPTQTPGGPSATPEPSNTSTPTDTAVISTATACALQFTDVPTDHTFYAFIHCLACRGIISGYTSGCETGNPCFRPGNNVTRGQTAKIVSNAAGFNEPVTEQSFEDVPAGSTFFDFIGRLASRGYITGYPCGRPTEPCVPPDNLPYFRPNDNVTRGQITKIVSEAAMFNDVPGGQQFEDVAPGSTFYTFTYRLVLREIMSGYPCGSPEPCVPPGNLPYFRPGNTATRGQTAKIVANTFYPNCQTPRRD